MKRSMNGIRVILVTVLVAGNVGCAGGSDETGVDDDGLIESTSDALEEENALTPNALTPNALTPNALTPNALTPNALTPNALSPEALSSLQDPGSTGELSRKLLRYTVGCALSPTQSFSFSWVDADGDAHDETYWGSLGLAPGWKDGPIGGDARRWVSGCLGSRLNYYGVSVLLSARGAHPRLAPLDPVEASTYSKREGAFWGDLFGASPYLYACNYGPNIANSRARMRDCAAGHVNDDGTVVSCGIATILGSCDDWCSVISTSGGYHTSCGLPSGGTTGVVVTTYLP